MLPHSKQWTLAALALSVSCIAVGSAQADVSISKDRELRTAASDKPWTSQRMRTAKPMMLQGNMRTLGEAREMDTVKSGPTIFEDGHRPKTEPEAAAPGAILPLPKSQEDGGFETRSKGSSGYPFTTSRVFPDASVQAWPYRLAGKLFMHDPRTNQDFVCTASIHSQRLVITAGHCLYNTTGNYFLTNFAFVPAYNGTATVQPFGVWNWAWATVTAAWANGSESFPHSADFGLIEMGDRVISGQVRQIGNYLGWFGWQTSALIGNHATTIGYPGNLDSGQRMIISNSQVFNRNGVAGEIGTAMWKGLSGGPWIQDFGIQSTGQSVTSTGPNRIIGISSYVPSAGNTPSQYAGSSILNSAFISIRNLGCAHRVGNC